MDRAMDVIVNMLSQQSLSNTGDDEFGCSTIQDLNQMRQSILSDNAKIISQSSNTELIQQQVDEKQKVIDRLTKEVEWLKTIKYSADDLLAENRKRLIAIADRIEVLKDNKDAQQMLSLAKQIKELQS